MAEKNEPRYPDPLDWSPRLRSIKSSRTTFARLMREYAKGKINNNSMRVWAYVFATFLNIAKTEHDYSIVDRLAELENRIKEIEGEKNESHQHTSFKKIK